MKEQKDEEGGRAGGEEGKAAKGVLLLSVAHNCRAVGCGRVGLVFLHTWRVAWCQAARACGYANMLSQISFFHGRPGLPMDRKYTNEECCDEGARPGSGAPFSPPTAVPVPGMPLLSGAGG